MTKASDKELKTCEEEVKKEMVVLLPHRADKFRYGGLKSTLAQHMSMGTNRYPRSLKKKNLLNTYTNASWE